MESYITAAHYDLISPDGRISSLTKTEHQTLMAEVIIENISPHFVGFSLDHSQVFFNLKSTLAQLGVNAVGIKYALDEKRKSAEVSIELVALSPIAIAMLEHLTVGAYIGKLFAKDDRRRVRDPDYLFRMFGREDRKGKPLLSLGGLREQGDLIVEKIQGRTIAFLALKDGVIEYESTIFSLIPTIGKALCTPDFKTRGLLQFHQKWTSEKSRLIEKNNILLVKTAPLHIRTVFGKVAEDLLPKGYNHTTASVLQPDTMASGDIYELFGNSSQIIDDIPLEFYTLEPHREYVFFSDRDQLQASLENKQTLFNAFDTAPEPKDHLAAVFIVKGNQLLNLKKEDWVIRPPYKHEFPGLNYPSRQVHSIEKYIETQPSYPFLKAIEDGQITSQGILLSRYFPSPLLKRLLLSERVQLSLKQIYFQIPSHDHDQYFSHEDRSLMSDLAKFAVHIFWADRNSGKLLRYVLKPEKDTGMFVPVDLIETFRKATVFGVYGSNLLEGDFEKELKAFLNGIIEMKNYISHPLLAAPLALLTGGGPGAMEVGNRVAKNLGLLSCANIVDFMHKESSVIHEQKQNPYIDAKMTYHLDRLVERQAEFYLDFPIFLMGGIGTDFEYTLEEVRRKVGSAPLTPIMLFGPESYWREKVTSRFQNNLHSGTIKGSEWVSNCFYCIQKASQGLEVFKRFFNGELAIGKNGPIYEAGFFTVPDSWH